jgi:hypothetical protein
MQPFPSMPLQGVDCRWLMSNQSPTLAYLKHDRCRSSLFLDGFVRPIAFHRGTLQPRVCLFARQLEEFSSLTRVTRLRREGERSGDMSLLSIRLGDSSKYNTVLFQFPVSRDLRSVTRTSQSRTRGPNGPGSKRLLTAVCHASGIHTHSS